MVYWRLKIGRISAFSYFLATSASGFRAGHFLAAQSFRSSMSNSEYAQSGSATHTTSTASVDENGDYSDGPSPLLVSSLQNLGKKNEKDKMQLVLASQSPRRREILDMMGLVGRYTVTPSPLDESALQKRLATSIVTPIEYTQTLAEEKANALAMALQESEKVNGQHTPGTLILGSDTIVDLDGKILEKPSSANAAIEMLGNLSGGWHKVHTGVSVYHLSSDCKVQKMSSFVETAEVKFAYLSQQDIAAYVETEEPMDKAGSYGIQGIGGQLVECIKGDFFTVMGLPMHRTSTNLSRSISTVMATF